MNDSFNAIAESPACIDETFDFEELEKLLDASLEEHLSDLYVLKDNHAKFGTPESLGHTVMNVVWEQFINQIGVVAGEDFIAENRGLTLDLRDSAHIQTTENFANGNIALHNSKIDYEQRYNNWQDNFARNENGDLKTHSTRTGKTEANLASGARDIFDKGRPAGSSLNKTAMDHTVSAAEIIRDPAANAHLSEKELIDFANSEVNLNEINSSLNSSKRDMSTTDWLDTPNKNGQKPSEIFDISEEQDQQLREKDLIARAEFDKQKIEGESRSKKVGKQSQKQEAFRIGGKALRTVIMGLLSELIKNVICKLVLWFRSGERKFSAFFDHLKEAIMKFVGDIKQHLLNATNNFVTTIVTAIIGPVVGMLKKAWIFLKQGYKSVKDAIDYIQNPENRDKPFSLMMLEVGKIVVAALTVGSALILGETIEKALMAIPVFAFEIPLLGSIASISGIFFGALVSGIIGAIALNLIDKAIANRQKSLNTQQQRVKKSDILYVQNKMIVVSTEYLNKIKLDTSNAIVGRHQNAEYRIKQSVEAIKNNDQNLKEERTKNDDKLDKLFDTLNNL